MTNITGKPLTGMSTGNEPTVLSTSAEENQSTPEAVTNDENQDTSIDHSRHSSELAKDSRQENHLLEESRDQSYGHHNDDDPQTSSPTCEKNESKQAPKTNEDKSPFTNVLLRLGKTTAKDEGDAPVIDKPQKKNVSWGEEKIPAQATKTTKQTKKAIAFGGMIRTITAVAGLKRWRRKSKDVSRPRAFEKYPGHLRVVQEHLRQEKIETPLTIRQEIKDEVLPILDKVVKAYRKELAGEHPLLREANFKYEKLKSELEDVFF